MPLKGRTRSERKADKHAALLRQRLQQAHDIALERGAGSKRWHACRGLHRLVAIDAIGDGVVIAAAEMAAPATTSSVRPLRQ